MRRALYTILLITALTIPVALTAGSAGAAWSPTARIAAAGQYPGATVSAIGQSQCAKPLAERSGNWLCPANPIPASTASSNEGYCKIQGCWYVYSVTKSGYSATGYFGYGETQLGEVKLYFEVTLNGAQSVSKPVRFEASAAVVNLIFEGNRLLYTPRYPAGIQVGGAGNTHLAGNIPAGETVQWTRNGVLEHGRPPRHLVSLGRRALRSSTWARAPTISVTTTISAKTRAGSGYTNG